MLDRRTSLQFLIADKINCLPVTFQESHGELKWFQNNVSSHKHWDAIKTGKSYSQFTLLTQSGRVALNRSVCTLVTSSTLPVDILTVWLHTYKLHQIENQEPPRVVPLGNFSKKVKSIKNRLNWKNLYETEKVMNEHTKNELYVINKSHVKHFISFIEDTEFQTLQIESSLYNEILSKAVMQNT